MGLDDNVGVLAYIQSMLRCVPTAFLVLAITLVGYQPFRGMTASAQQSAMQMTASAHADCMEMASHDCCDTEANPCLGDTACVARCHINMGLEAAFVVPSMRLMRTQVVVFTEPPQLHAARAGPLFRPPII